MRLEQWLSPALVCIVPLLLFEWSCRGAAVPHASWQVTWHGLFWADDFSLGFCSPQSPQEVWGFLPTPWWSLTSQEQPALAQPTSHLADVLLQLRRQVETAKLSRFLEVLWMQEVPGGDRCSSPFPAPVASSSPLLGLHKGHKQQEGPPCAQHVWGKCWPGDRGQDPATIFCQGHQFCGVTCSRRQLLSHPCYLGQKLDAKQVVSCLCYCKGTLSHYFFSACAQQPVRYKDEQPLWGFLYIFCAFSLQCGTFKLNHQRFWVPAEELGAVQCSVLMLKILTSILCIKPSSPCIHSGEGSKPRNLVCGN